MKDIEENGSTKITWTDLKKLMPVAFALCVCTISISYIYPYASRMLLEIGMITSITDAGYFNPYYTMAYFLGRAITSTLWGSLSDRHSRKRTL